MKKILIFDFDGVILDSVLVKGDAFGYIFKDYGDEIVDKVKEYHKQNGGLPRAEKIKNIFSVILKKHPPQDVIDKYCRKFSIIVVDMVLKTDFIPGSFKFIKDNCNLYDQYIVSATPQKELEIIIKKRKIRKYFKDIYGSPIDKHTHIKSIISNNGCVFSSAVFIGDSFSDLESSIKAGVEFIGVKSSSITFPIEVNVIDNLLDLESELNKL